MTAYEITAQAIGMVAMAMNCLSYQRKTQKEILLFQLVGSMLFAVNFFMLGAYAGGLLNLIGVLRAIVFVGGDRLRAKHPAWLIGFCTAFVLSYGLVFTAFEKEPTALHLIVELLPVIAMILTTVSFRLENAKSTRRFGLGSSPLWLVYNCFSMAIGAIVCESLNLASIVVGMLRYDLPKKNIRPKLIALKTGCISPFLFLFSSRNFGFSIDIHREKRYNKHGIKKIEQRFAVFRFVRYAKKSCRKQNFKAYRHGVLFCANTAFFIFLIFSVWKSELLQKNKIPMLKIKEIGTT